MHFNWIIYLFFLYTVDYFNKRVCYTSWATQTGLILLSAEPPCPKPWKRLKVFCQGRTTKMNKTTHEWKDPPDAKHSAGRAFNASSQREQGLCEAGIRCADSCKISILRNLEERSNKCSPKLFFNFISYFLTSFAPRKIKNKTTFYWTHITGSLIIKAETGLDFLTPHCNEVIHSAALLIVNT